MEKNNPGAALIDAYDYIEVQALDLPVYCMAAFPGNDLAKELPAAARPASGRVASGRGLSRDACRASAFGEAIELASSCSWNDEPVWANSMADIELEFCSPGDLLGLSSTQWANRQHWNRLYHAYDKRPRRCNDKQSIDWYVAEQACSGKSVAVPADLVFIGRRDIDDGGAVGFADSNGCASAATPAAAKVTALLELIERDATARWWYGARRRRRIALDALDDNTSLKQALSDRHRITHLFDITTDIGLPCVAAVSAETDGSRVAMGFSARPQPVTAVRDAITEMAQIEISLQAAIEHDQIDAGLRCWLEQTNGNDELFNVTDFTELQDTRLPSSDHDLLSELLHRCEAVSCRVFFADLTRSRFRVPVYRALSPDLCHYKPRFGRARLLATDERDIVPVNFNIDLDTVNILFI